MSKPEYKQNISLAVAKDLFAGSMGGVAQVLSGQPFDIVKVRMQKQSTKNPEYSGMFDCVRKIIKNEGLHGFYKGTLSPLAGIAGCVSIQFGANEAAKRIVRRYNERKGAKDPLKLSVKQFIFCGAMAGAWNTFVSCPVEHIRIVMQSQTNKAGTKGRFTGSYDALTSIYRQYGLRMVYRGFIITMLREIISYGSWFGTYESLKAATTSPEKPGSLLWLMFCGSIAGEAYWLSSYPIDVTKTKIQSDSLDNPKYKGILDTMRKTYRADGWMGFWKGIVPCVIRASIASGCTFGTFELVMKFITPFGATKIE